MFLGYIPIDEAFRILELTLSASVPTDSSTVPLYRVYSDAGLIESGTLSVAETGAITGATNTSPIVITSANHGLTTGQRVTISGVGGNTNANGTFTITRVDANTFSLNGSAGNAGYTTGGTWSTTGLYSKTITPTFMGGYAQGGHYDVIIYSTIGGNVQASQHRFGVV